MNLTNKIVSLGLALANFGAAMALLTFVDDAFGYALVGWSLMVTAVCIWLGRLWK
ncbi:hypothetical protein [Pseudomonas sp. CCI2.4]|uniref:hypothetical protein n=1 Tax=Pseudomonas sp. CCI2.4 TaxID=3048617 RepID=UPI002B23CB75|nr:hypothetical protein [Pseudomonas sp. CCI2.4]MEB0133597.1 hypothetical protein [Pseudomonas sp. CCI2.4]